MRRVSGPVRALAADSVVRIFPQTRWTLRIAALSAAAARSGCVSGRSFSACPSLPQGRPIAMSPNARQIRGYALFRTSNAAAKGAKEPSGAVPPGGGDPFFSPKYAAFDDGAPPSFPQPYVDEHAAQRLHVKLLSAFDPGRSPPPPANALVVACPHPGAVYYLEDLVRRTAHAAGADFLSLDLKDLYDYVHEPGRGSHEAALDDPAFRPRPLTFGARVFRLSHYDDRRIAAHDDGTAASEPYEEGEEDEDDRYGGYSSSFDDAHPDDEPDVDMEPPASDMSWSGGRVAPADDVPRPERAAVPAPSHRGYRQGDRAPHRHDSQDAVPPGESAAAAAGDLSAACAALASHLARFARVRGSKAPLVVYLKDLNDFDTERSRPYGPQILESVLGCVDGLRGAGLPVVLTAGACPSVIYSAIDPAVSSEDEYKAQKAAIEGAEELRAILAGEKTPKAGIGFADDELRLLPYRHILSSKSNPVATINLSPPPLPKHPLTSNTTTSIPRSDDDSPAAVESRFLEWERAMRLDQQRRVAEINWRSTAIECSDRGRPLEAHPLGALLGGADAAKVFRGAQGSRGWTGAEDALLARGFQRFGCAWDDVASFVGSRTADMCAERWAELVSGGSGDLQPTDAELAAFLGALRAKLWEPSFIRETVNNANGVRLRHEALLGGAAPVSVPATLSLRHLMEGIENERMNDPEYREQKDEARIAARHRREAEAHLESRGAAGGRGDGGLAALADTVDNREEAQVSPPRAAQQQAYPPSGAEEGRNDQGAIRDFLQERGYKPNTYEKKLLSCVVDPSAIGVGFSDLILPPSTKLALQTLVTLPLLRPKLFSHGILQKSSFTGVLLFGPPGTGKTFLAKCVARSGGARFMNVALSDVFDKYVGEGEKNVKAVFTLARKLAPCVVFIDEVDALFGRRKGDTFASRREVMNEFMGEWDGIGGGNSGVIIMAATNRPFDLDDAILRRMPRRILVDLPNEESRAKILGVHLKDEQLHDSISLVDLAKRTELYSGSDLRNLCISAALASVKENVVREARHGLPPLTDPAAEDPELRARILKEMDEIDEWSSVVGDGTAQAQSPGGSQRLLTKEHFEIALKEIPASLTDDMESLAELRKWDMQYGGAGQRKGVKPGWGFSAT